MASSFVSWKNNKSEAATPPTLRKETSGAEALTEDEEFGVMEQLKNLVESFTVDTFKNFPLEDDQERSITPAIQHPLPLPISGRICRSGRRSMQLSFSPRSRKCHNLDIFLCPHHLKDRQFWRVYFKRVKDYVALYEIRAIQRAKLKRMGMEDANLSSMNAYAVEMVEANQATSVSPPASFDNDSGSFFFG